MATNTVNLSQFNKDDLKSANKFKYGIIVSEWNSEITGNLSQAANETLIELGVNCNSISIYNVPGSFELIYAASQLCKSKKFDAVIVIGSIIKGETAHFDYICQGVTQGIKDLNINYNTPVIFCVLTDLNIKQSQDRSGGKYGNKGVEAAVSAIKMAHFNKEMYN